MNIDTGVKVIPVLIGAAVGQIALILAQAVEAPLRASPWTPELITALFAGIAGLVGAVASMIVMLRSAKKDVKEVRKIVDGGRTALLKEVRDLKRQIAELSNRKSDADAAIRADEAVEVSKEVTDRAADERKE